MLCEPDPLLNCPYDLSHRIVRSRLQWHLKRCEKNHAKADKLYCLYNATHIVDRLEYEHHVDNCDNRKLVLETVYKEEDIEKPEDSQRLHGVIPIEEILGMTSPVQSEENWDEDCGAPSYDPFKMTEDRPVLRMKVGLSKAKKKQFRDAERQRIAALLAKNETAKNETVSDKTKKKTTPKKMEESPLRVPREHSRALSRDCTLQSMNDTTMSICDNDKETRNTTKDITGNVTDDLSEAMETMQVENEVDKKNEARGINKSRNNRYLRELLEKPVVTEENIDQSVKSETEASASKSFSSICNSQKVETSTSGEENLSDTVSKIWARISMLSEEEERIRSERVKLTDMLYEIRTKLPKDSSATEKSSSSQSSTTSPSQNQTQIYNESQNQSKSEQETVRKTSSPRGVNDSFTVIQDMMPKFHGRGIRMMHDSQRKSSNQRSADKKPGVQLSETVAQNKEKSSSRTEYIIRENISAIIREKQTTPKRDNVPAYNDMECSSFYGYGEDSDDDFELESK